MRIRLTPCVLIVLATILRLWVATAVPLFPDETYYWDWSRHLAAGYFDHPPGIALLIRVGTILFGDTRIGVRIGAIVAGAITSWALVALTRQLDDSRSGTDESAMRAAILAICIPVALVGFVLATPDAPLLAAVTVTLVALDRAFAAPYRSADALRWWCAAGVMLGVGLCTKYTAVLLPFGVFIAMLIHPRLRSRLGEPGPYIATLLAVAIFLPVILWNARHDWISFAFQFKHGLGTPKGSPLSRELNLVGAQLGLLSPIIAVMTAIAVVRSLRHRTDDRRFAIAAIAASVFAFFAFSALRKPVEANWPAPALIAALPLLATWHVYGASSRWFRWGALLAAACTIVISVHASFPFLPLPPRRDPITRAYGWGQVAARVNGISDSVSNNATCAHVWIAADRYQDASELAFHVLGHPAVFSLNLGGRPNQYNLWQPLQSVFHPGDCTILVVDDSPAGADIAKRAADSIQPDDAGYVALTQGQRYIGRRHIWLLRSIRL
jgi:4-amino-4-deoxy-L-arabinose transferase-like glycosyltransferase